MTLPITDFIGYDRHLYSSQICMPTTTPDPLQIAAEQKVLAPQTMPEERTNQNILEAGGCSWREDAVENGHTWNPRVLPYGEVQCVTCACKVIIF